MQRCTWFVLLFALSQFRCAGLGRSLLSDTARYQFSRQNSCPEDRLTLQAISLNARDLVTLPDPPPDVARDPGRLAVWRAMKLDDVADYMDLTAIGVSGCGYEQTYLCWIERAPYGEELEYQCEETAFDERDSRLGNFALDWPALKAIHERLRGPSPPIR